MSKNKKYEEMKLNIYKKLIKKLWLIEKNL